VNKKGFTLIEIIICISLLALVGITSVTLYFNTNNKDKKREKIISDVIASADVFYSSNTDIQNKLNNNYGYYVIKINDLKEMGLLDKDFVIPEKNSSDPVGADYTKIVITDLKDIETLVSSDGDLGLIEYIYPYVPGDPFIANLLPISMEYFEKESFLCNTGISNNKIDYMSQDYKITSISNFKCAVADNNASSIDFSQLDYLINYNQNLNLKVGDNLIGYKITVDGLDVYSDRTIYVNKEYNPAFISKSNNKPYTCGTWTNKDVNLQFIQEEYTTLPDGNLSFVWSKNSSATNNTNSLFIASSTGLYTGKYTLKGVFNKTAKKEGQASCQINIDKTQPVITVTDGERQKIITFTDAGGSMHYGYIKSTTKYTTAEKNNLTKDNFTVGTTLTIPEGQISQNYYIYAIDNAGNITERTVYVAGEEMYPEITYEPIENSFSKFKVTIKDISGRGYDLSEVKLQYTFNKEAEFYYESIGKSEGAYKEAFDLNYAYKNWSSLSKVNSIDKTADCEGKTECSFEIDMFDIIDKCIGDINCYKILDYSSMYKLNIDYHIYAKNNQNKYREIKLNSVLNSYIDEKVFDEKLYNANIASSTMSREADIISVNEDGDILFQQKIKNGDGSDYYIYYYDNINNVFYTVLDEEWLENTKRNREKIGYSLFNTSYIKYKICKTDENLRKIETTYTYSLKSHKITGKSSKTYYNVSNFYCSGTSVIDVFDYSSIKYTSLPYSFSIINYLYKIDDYSEKVYKNPDSFGVYNISNRDIDNKIFNSQIDGTIWNSILTYKLSDRNEKINKLFFQSGVTLNEISNNRN